MEQINIQNTAECFANAIDVSITKTNAIVFDCKKIVFTVGSVEFVIDNIVLSFDDFEKMVFIIDGKKHTFIKEQTK